jgi:superfamily II DNA or RNA helicase
MDLTGTLPWQPPHIAALLAALQKYGSVLDASDTGTGKTFCILIICRILGITPLVVGPKAARAGWEDAGKILGVEFEYINYEKCRPRLVKQTEEEFTANGFNEKRESEYTIEVPWGKGSFVKWRNSYEMVIFDEAHRLGGTTSLNSKLGIAAKRQAKYVVALSATAADDPRQMKALGYILGIHGLNTIKCETKLNWKLAAAPRCEARALRRLGLHERRRQAEKILHENPRRNFSPARLADAQVRNPWFPSDRGPGEDARRRDRQG